MKEGRWKWYGREPFDGHPREYEQRFDRNHLAYQSELEAVRAQLPETGEGFKISVGSGLFAAPIGMRHGVEPSEAMRKLARRRGSRLSRAWLRISLTRTHPSTSP